MDVGSDALRDRRSLRVRHRNDQPRLHAGLRSSGCLSASSPARPPTCRSRTTIAGAPEQLDRADDARAAEAAARGHDAQEGRPSPQVRRARAEGLRHRPCRHALRLDARVLRAELDRDAPRHGLLRQALSRRRHHQVRGRRRQGREAAHLQPGAGRSGRRVRGRGRGRHAAAAPRPPCRAGEGTGAATGLRGDRAAARAGAARDGAPRRARGPRSPEEAERRDREAPRRARNRGPRLGRPAVQPRLAEAAPGDPVQQAGAAGAAEDAHRAALHRRGRARGARRALSRCRGSSSSTAASRSCARPTPRSCPSRSTRRPGACTPPITRPSR